MANWWWKKLGPGLITGASDDDPSGIVTYTQAGARFGLGLLWVAIVTTPLMMAIQEMVARLGLVTKQGLGALLRNHVSKKLAVVVGIVIFLVNTFNIGADLGAMADAVKLVLPGPETVYLVFFLGLVIGLEIVLPYKKYVNVLKWLTLALLTYVAAALVATPNWWPVAQSLAHPLLHGGSQFWLMLVAVLGTTISPYLFFWQASEEIEEGAHKKHSDASLREQLTSMRRDTVVGMMFSNVVMFFIIVTAAVTLNAHGIMEVVTAKQAATTLAPIAGQLTFLLFTVGIIGTGLLAVPILAGSAAYALADAFHWHEGLSKKFRQARRFYLVIIGSILAAFVTHFFGISPIRLLFLAAVLNGLVAPLILWFIVRLANRTDIVGEHRSSPAINAAGWLIFALMTVGAGAAVLQLFGVV